MAARSFGRSIVVVRGARTKLAVGLTLSLLASVVFVSSSWAVTSTVPRAVTRTLHRYIQVRFVQNGAAMDPISVTCKRAAVNRYACSWLAGGYGPGDYRVDYGGRASVLRRGSKLIVNHVAVTCSPDGLHDVCPSPPLTLGR
jgi:hypothetical protein